MMSKTTQLSITAQEGIKCTLEQGVVHPYVLNDKRAASVMLSNAKLTTAETINESSQTTHIQMSPGAFSQVIFPLISYWKKFPMNQILLEGNTQVTLKDVRAGEEENGKIVDALAKFLYDGKKISMFAYCTNQTIMVQGANQKEFLASFLLPVLKRSFNENKDTILKYNNMVIKSLTKSPRIELDDSVSNSTTPERGLKMRLRRSSVTCQNCGKEFPSKRLLELHTSTAHSERTRAKPHGSVKNSRKLINSITLTDQPPGRDDPTRPSLGYEADSDLLLTDTEDSSVEECEPSLAVTRDCSPRLEKWTVASSTLRSETSSNPKSVAEQEEPASRLE